MRSNSFPPMVNKVAAGCERLASVLSAQRPGSNAGTSNSFSNSSTKSASKAVAAVALI